MRLKVEIFENATMEQAEAALAAFTRLARLKALGGCSDVTLGTKVDAMRLKVEVEIFENATMEQAEAALAEWLTAPIVAILTKEEPADKSDWCQWVLNDKVLAEYDNGTFTKYHEYDE